MTRRRARLVRGLGVMAIAITLGLGLWQLGHGVYIHAKAELAQILLARAWNQTLVDGGPHKAWSWADTWPVAQLTVPRLDQSAIILDGASGEAMAFGPGHMHGTPRIAEPGTAILSAHRDTHFAFLKNIKLGDVIEVTRDDGRRFKFSVTSTRIVDAAASGIQPFSGPPQLALVTCYPFDATEHGSERFVVFASLATSSVAAR